MATTTNYGWTTPDDTALVKDGAAAIRTLGSSVDSTTKALNPSTTLGDIEYRSSTANTNTRLGIGTSGQILTVSGGVPAWATPAAGGGLTSIASGSIGSVTTFTISSIPSTYKALRLQLQGVKGTTRLNLRCNGDTGGSNYSFSHVLAVQSPLSSRYSASENRITLLEANNVYATNASYWCLDLTNYASTTSPKAVEMNSYYQNASTNDPQPCFGLGGWKNITDAVSSLTVFTDGDTFTAGTYTLWGVN